MQTEQDVSAAEVVLDFLCGESRTETKSSEIKSRATFAESRCKRTQLQKSMQAEAREMPERG
jgi:proteasome assembly chaperone (PAC2) family protein